MDTKSLHHVRVAKPHEITGEGTGVIVSFQSGCMRVEIAHTPRAARALAQRLLEAAEQADSIENKKAERLQPHGLDNSGL